MEGLGKPYFDKIIGNKEHIPEFQENLHEYVLDVVSGAARRKIENLELTKSDRERTLIWYAEQEADKLMVSHGRQNAIELPSIDSVHVLTENGVEKYTDGRLGRGAHSTLFRAILVDRTQSEVEFTITTFHEIVHLKSYSALQYIPAGKDREARVDDYRSGISVFSRDGKTKYLDSLEEAIVTYLTKEFYEKRMANDGRFKEEIASRKDDFSPVFGDEENLEKFMSLADQIAKDNPKEFPNRKEVVDVFIAAQLNGSLVKVVRLLERTLGTGSVKKIDRIELA